MESEASLPWTVKMTIYGGCAAAAAAGIPGAFMGPGGDVPIIVSVWAGATVLIGNRYGAGMDKTTALKLCGMVASGVALALAGMKGAASVFAYTGVGTIPAIAANGGLNGAVTFLFLRAVATSFQSKETFETIGDFAKSILTVILASVGVRSNDDSV